MPAGRPTTCTPEIQEKAWEYVNGGWEELDHAFPSTVGLCDFLSIGRSTLYLWRDRDDNRIMDILDAINTKQQLVAWNKGLKGDYNANLVKLLLGKHGYSEKQDNTHSGPDGNPIEIDHSWEVKIIG